jgi:hypothetical protein
MSVIFLNVILTAATDVASNAQQNNTTDMKTGNATNTNTTTATKDYSKLFSGKDFQIYLEWGITCLHPIEVQYQGPTMLVLTSRYVDGIWKGMLGITDPKMSEWVQERLARHPYSTYEDPPPYGTPESASIPRTYIHLTVGPLSSWMEPFAARARKLESNVHTMATGHDVMITNPNELAEILLRIANK